MIDVTKVLSLAAKFLLLLSAFAPRPHTVILGAQVSDQFILCIFFLLFIILRGG